MLIGNEASKIQRSRSHLQLTGSLNGGRSRFSSTQKFGLTRTSSSSDLCSSVQIWGGQAGPCRQEIVAQARVLRILLQEALQKGVAEISGDDPSKATNLLQAGAARTVLVLLSQSCTADTSFVAGLIALGRRENDVFVTSVLVDTSFEFPGLEYYTQVRAGLLFGGAEDQRILDSLQPPPSRSQLCGALQRLFQILAMKVDFAVAFGVLQSQIRQLTSVMRKSHRRWEPYQHLAWESDSSLVSPHREDLFNKPVMKPLAMELVDDVVLCETSNSVTAERLLEDLVLAKASSVTSICLSL